MKVRSVQDSILLPTIKVLVVGNPGSGKTRSASTWPNPVYLNLDDGLMSVRDRDVRAVDIRSIEDINEVLKACRLPAPQRAKAFGGQDVGTIVFDTLDEVARMVVRERLAAEKKDTMAQADWGHLGEVMRNIVRNFRGLDDLNVVFNVHVRSQEDSDTGRVEYKPSIQGAFGDEVAGYVDLALLVTARTSTDPQTKKKVTTRYMQTYPDSQRPWIKDRSGALPMEFLINFEDDFKRFFKTIFGTEPETQAEQIAALAADLAAEREERDAEETKAQAAAAQAKVTAAQEKARAAAGAAKKAAPKKAGAKKAAPKPPAAEAPADPDPDPDPIGGHLSPAEEKELAAEQATDSNVEMEVGSVTVVDETPEDPEPELSIDADPEPDDEPEAEPEAATPSDDNEAGLPDDDASDIDGEGEGQEVDAAADDAAIEGAVTPPEPAEESAPAAGALPDCSKCGKQVENEDIAELSVIRFKEPLCRQHFAQAKATNK